MNAAIAVSIRNVSKKFKLFGSRKERLAEALHPFQKPYHTEFWALKGVSFEVGRGEVIGILGRNGSGKTTLLQIISSVMMPTHGDIQSNGRISTLLGLGVGFNPDFTGRNNALLNGILIGVPRQEMLRRMPAIKAFADIGEFFDQPMRTYSSGMFMRVSFAVAIHVDSEILIVDEVLGVGDTKFQEKCFRRINEIRETGGTIIFVSHDLNYFSSLCDRVVVLDGGEVQLIAPPVAAIDKYYALLYRETPPRFEEVDESRDCKPKKLDPVEAFLSYSANEERFHLGTHYNPNEQRMGSSIARITDYLILCDGELLKDVMLRGGETISLLLKIFSSQDIGTCYCGYAINSVDGVKIFAESDRLDPKRPGFELRSGTTVSVRFDFVNRLNSGYYFINVGIDHIVESELVAIDWRRSSLSISVSTDQIFDGLCNLRAKPMELIQSYTGAME